MRNNVFFLNDNTVLYPVGHQLVQYNFEKKTQKIIPVNLDGDVIGCIAISFVDNSIAIASKTPDLPSAKAKLSSSPAIYIIDLNSFKRKKVIKITESSNIKVDLVNQEFLSVSFTTDGKYIMAQGCAPDWMLLIWTLEKGKLISSGKSTSGISAIGELSCNSFVTDTIQICATGENLFRSFRLQDGFLKLIHQTKLEQVFIFHPEHHMSCLDQ